MNKFILLLMIFMHIVADFNLQGWMATSKQKSYWKDKGKCCKYDYIIVLLVHSFQWTFLITLPIVIFKNGFNFNSCFIIIFVINMLIHFFADDLKCNRKIGNLITDQILHILQIILIYYCLI